MGPDRAASTLSWWRESGVDTLVGEVPRDWLNPAPGVRAPAPTAAAEPLPETLSGLREWLLTSESVPLATPGMSRIGPAGDPASGLMILVDMPSAEDLGAGALVTGEVGAMFDRMLARIGRDRASIYLASLSVVRTPTGKLDPDGAKRLAQIALHHVGLVAPKAVLLLGDTCSKALVGSSAAAARGRWHVLDTGRGTIKAIVTMSLHYLFGQPSARKDALKDLQLLIEGLTP